MGFFSWYRWVDLVWRTLGRGGKGFFPAAWDVGMRDEKIGIAVKEYSFT